MDFPREWFEDEVREGFYISGMVKRDWASQLEILHTLDTVCEKYHLRWFMAFGALLGTVRHHGFIPWDDDLDIFMPADDFEKFREAVSKELSDGYYVNDGCNAKSHGLISVFGYQYRKENLEQEMEQFHDFPYSPSIDIFRLSYVSDDPRKEQWRDNGIRKVLSAAAYFQGDLSGITRPSGIKTDTVTIEDLEKIQRWSDWAKTGLDYLGIVEQETEYSFDRKKPIIDQLYTLLNHLFLYFSASECSRMAFLPSFINRGVQCYPKEYADHMLRVPFENMKVCIPEAYEQVLIDRFGRDYMTFYKGAATHAYPGFKRFEENMLRQSGMQDQNPFVYRFQKEDLNKRDDIKSAPKSQAATLLEKLQECHRNLHHIAMAGEWRKCFALYHQCEDLALQLGTLIRSAGGANALNQIPVQEYEKAIVQSFTYSLHHQPIREKDLETADEAFQRFSDAIRNHFLSRKEVLFLPVKAKNWKAMESLWRASCADTDCDVTVMPLPYFEKDGLCGLRGNAICEREKFPEEVHAVSYEDYRIRDHHPDYIIIQSPYDQFNYTETVAPEFYSTQLRSMTDHLVYLPWFLTSEFGPKDLDTVPMQFYAAMPGVVQSDLTIVQSENIRCRYIEVLTAFAGENTQPVWERKIQGWGSTLQDSAGIRSDLWTKIKAYFAEDIPNETER